jgi:hypothetical protein
MGGGGSKCPEPSNEAALLKPSSIIQPGYICPNGRSAQPNSAGFDSCEPIKCNTALGSVLKTDAKGTYGCTMLGKPDDPPVICPYGTTNTLGTCMPILSLPGQIPVTDNNNYCPKGYDMAFTGVGGSPVCNISSSPNAGIGNIIKTCKVIGGGNVNSSDPNVVRSGGYTGPCPEKSNFAITTDCLIGCAIGSSPAISCSSGYMIDANNNLKCMPSNGPASSSSASTSSSMPSLAPVPTLVRFTNVYDFKSKRERNVENFSQNNNSKCKARY